MPNKLILLPLLMCASPALAQSPAPEATQEAQRVLGDPAMADRLADTVQAFSKAVLDLRIGELQAAVEGRKPTAAERKLTVRDVSKVDEKDLQRRMAEAKPQIERSMKALSEALPAMMKSMDEVGKALDRAAANMPDPTYPKQ